MNYKSGHQARLRSNMKRHNSKLKENLFFLFAVYEGVTIVITTVMTVPEYTMTLLVDNPTRLTQFELNLR